MITSVIGYPRVGPLRELKFASEEYFQNNITQETLQETAKNLRLTHWTTQKKNGITLIPSNDFSFYDTVLDAAVLLNIVPARYRALGLSPLDTYFAMARGHQDRHGDVKALALKKWFNTNYHYLVPEIDGQTEIRLAGDKPFAEFTEALAAGITTKPVLLGPFTLLKLARYGDGRSAGDCVADVVSAYKDILDRFKALGASWLQLDEPALVCDLNDEDLALVEALYKPILAHKGDLRILLQTFFGDVRDGYPRLTALAFDGIGLDFVEGRKTLELVRSHGFPADKILFAGIVNGKNIWKNEYAHSLNVLAELQALNINVALSTSCSLLHVPYTLAHEQALDEAYKRHFAFAIEKLGELADLQAIAGSEAPFRHEAATKNALLFAAPRTEENPSVRAQVNAIRPSDYTRTPDFHTREALQKKHFNLPLFPTTTIGSFPQTADVKANRSALRAGQISEAEYTAFNRKKIAECVALQEDIGLDVLVHGEFERNDMVEYFGERLHGFVFTEKAWVQSYGTRCVKPPIIWGDVARACPLTVEWSAYAQSLTDKPLKGMLTGPVTILNWSFPREDISLEACARQIALAIRAEVLDLEAAGIKIIQIDEAALREKLPLRQSDWESDYLNWAIPVFRLVHSGVAPDTQIHTHMCYSEFADIIPAIDGMDADVITFEASRSDLLILDALQAHRFKTEVGPGVYDIHSPRIPSTEEIKLALEKMRAKIPADKLWINPDCGLKTRGPAETKPSLEHMVAAAIQLRHEYC